MDFNAKQDEHYVDGHDKWTVHYSISDNTRVNPGDYTEVTQIDKNGEIVGQATSHKDKSGNNKAEPWVEGVQGVPSTARKVKK
jgi:hypothetical protein